MTEFELFNESGESIPLIESDFFSLLSLVASGEDTHFSLIEAVYVDESGIQEINQKYLGKNYVTDVITFTYSDDTADNHHASGSDLEGTIYMCAQRIKEQAAELSTDEIEEFKRVFIHGLLHLCGYDDTDDASKAEMTRKENLYLVSQ